MEFPYGKAPLAILLLAVCRRGACVAVGGASAADARPGPDLRHVHQGTRRRVPPGDRRRSRSSTTCTVQSRSSTSARCRAGSSRRMQVGAEVPDMVELLDGTMGFFTKGPLEDVGFVDLTDRVEVSGPVRPARHQPLRQVVEPRPHLRAAARRAPDDARVPPDLVEQLGIDVSKLTTWDEFCRVGREIVTKDLDGDGVIDHYMIDLPPDGGDTLRLLLLQRGVRMFDARGRRHVRQRRARRRRSAGTCKQIAGPRRASRSRAAGGRTSPRR